ncbi:putative UbiX-like flavin prenyltransferase [Synergistales bacterium]|nr:putative UbiX-like flavin prenyltransferase [Synergistales bacterium]
MKIVVGISGASGAIYAVSLLKALKELGIETHLVVTSMGRHVAEHECGMSINDLQGLSSYYHDNENLAAPISSGSFKVDKMVVVPCSMKTLSGVANGYSDSLLSRACDVTIKEGRKLILAVRETPLSPIHLKNMLVLSQIGVTIFPPSPGFYSHPETVEDIVLNITGKILDLLDIDNDLTVRWK